jgi:hypothetical protein
MNQEHFRTPLSERNGDFATAISEKPRKFLAYNPFTAKKERVMKRFVWATALVISILGWREPWAQSNPLRVIAEFSGASLKWIHVAEPEFQRRKLNLDNYTVRVVEHDDSIVVSLSALNAAKGTRGSSGSYPAFEVEIDKKDLKVVRSNYVR